MNKNKILVWIIVLLVVLNIATVGTILYNNSQMPAEPETIVVQADGCNMMNGKYFRQNIGFDHEQMAIFRQAKHEFQPRANQIVGTIDSLKNEMFTELKKDTPDTLLLNKLSEETGRCHAELKKETNRFYLKVFKICTPEQVNQMQEVFSPLFLNRGCRNNENTGRNCDNCMNNHE
ncbi:MAG: hypothetical protein PHH37_13795 [Paludibacter sp.]|nr:hypothetical protein [Paludibacter sp.]